LYNLFIGLRVKIKLTRRKFTGGAFCGGARATGAGAVVSPLIVVCAVCEL
jgi:hypothetical protein